MRVLHVAAGNLYGGVERILATIARTPAAPLRHEFALCFDSRLARELEDAGARVHALGPVRFSRPTSVWRARRRLRAALEGQPPVAVIAHSPWAYRLAAPAAGRHGRLAWIHDALDGRHWTERSLLRDPPGIAICNSRYSEAALRRWAPALTTAVIHAPVTAPAGVRSRADVRREVGDPDARVIIAIASRFERWKGHLDLLRAAERLRGDWGIWIAGEPQRESERGYAREIAEFAARPALAGRVRHLGARGDIADVLAAADVLCQPNTAPEPFGIVFVEALLAGIPVVTARGGGADEVLDDTCGIRLSPGDVPALGAALQHLVDDAGARRALGSAGPARARLLCDPARQLSRLHALLPAVNGAAA
jgi:glycosyltransferase involved in cell wall biosynthesis